MTELEGPLFRRLAEQREGLAECPPAGGFADAATALETALEGCDWVLGERFTVADVPRASILGGAYSRELLEPWPRLRAYVTRAEIRPAHVPLRDSDT